MISNGAAEEVGTGGRGDAEIPGKRALELETTVTVRSRSDGFFAFARFA